MNVVRGYFLLKKEKKEKRKKERASLFLFSLQLELGGVRDCFHSAILHIQVMFLTFFFSFLNMILTHFYLRA